MNLGSIAHLQYYFARTGLLDGKGGQMATKDQNGENDRSTPTLHGPAALDSPVEEEGQLGWEAAQEEGGDIMLPPTVSTYSDRTQRLQPLPDHGSLKKNLVDALESALHALEDVSWHSTTSEGTGPTEGCDEIYGLHILDITTFAIRAARMYYIMHPNPARLNQVKPDYQVRRDLISVLDVLKRWAARKFAGGLHEDERVDLLVWISEVGMMIDQETRLEDSERRERDRLEWMNGATWAGREKERETNFLSSLLYSSFGEVNPSLPEHTHVSQEQTQTKFLNALADGRKLIQMHNEAVKRSRKQFGQIGPHHTDVDKPYRRAENLRFWIKAAQLRWEVKLDVNVMGVVSRSRDHVIWSSFDEAVMKWSKTVREELTRDWKSEEERKLHARAKSLALAGPPPRGPTERTR